MPSYSKAYIECVRHLGGARVFECYATLEPENWQDPLQFGFLIYVLGGTDARSRVIDPEELSPVVGKAYCLDAEIHRQPPEVTFLNWSDAASQREAEVVALGRQVTGEMLATISALKALGPSARLVVWSTG